MCINGTSPRDWPHVVSAAVLYPDCVVPHFGLHPMHGAQYGKEIPEADHLSLLEWLRGCSPPATLAAASASPSRASQLEPPSCTPDWLLQLQQLLLQAPNAHVGETGLHKPGAGCGTLGTLGVQRQLLSLHLALAQGLQRSVTVHCVKAFGALADELQAAAAAAEGATVMAGTEFPLGVPIVCHSFSGSSEVTRRLQRLGAYFSISGSVSNPAFKAVRAAAVHVPLHRLLLESDCPDQPLWGGQGGGSSEETATTSCCAASTGALPAMQHHSCPEDVLVTAAAIADLRGCTAVEVVKAANQNATLVFRDSSLKPSAEGSGSVALAARGAPG